MRGQRVCSRSQNVIGSWTLVSNTSEQDGKITNTFGRNPKDTAIFDSNGHFAITIVRADLPKIASNNRGGATSKESQAVLKGSIAYFGTYTFNEAEKAIVIQVEGATFANWVGTTQKRQLTVSGDQIRLVDAAPHNNASQSTAAFGRIVGREDGER